MQVYSTTVTPAFGVESREQQEVRIRAAPAPQAAGPPSPRLSKAHGCAVMAPTLREQQEHRTSTPSETTRTPSAAPLTAASIGFAAISDPVSDE